MWGRLLPADINLAKKILSMQTGKNDKSFLVRVDLYKKGFFFGMPETFKTYDDYDIY